MTRTRGLEPDRDQIEIFADAMLRHAGDAGFISLRAFLEDDSGKSFRITPISRKGNFRFLMDAVVDDARRAANAPKPVVFCPPLAIFSNKDRAREEDITRGLAISVELDQNPDEARAKLEEILGAATVIVRSGGIWLDADHEPHDKLHVHWRLKEPASGKAALAQLKQARDLAARLVGGDPTNKAVCHPIRWPGSWHRKKEPRLCGIAVLRPDAEIDLTAALAALTAAAPEAATRQQRQAEGNTESTDWGEPLGDLLAGNNLHNSIAVLSAKLIAGGLGDGAAVNVVRGLLDCSQAPRDARFHSRYADVPRAVSTAREKIGTAAPQRRQDSEIVLLGAEGIVMESITWLWSNHLARGKLTMLSGPSELGKSTLAVDLVARLSCGSEWPDGDEAPRGSAVILSAEDGLADTVKPRLVAAGADLSRVHLLPFVNLASGGRRTFSLQADLEKLGEKLREIGDVSLLVIDPVTAYMGGNKIDSHRTVDVRGVLEPLQKTAEAFRFAALLISHPQKAAATNVLNVVTGSAAFVNAPRMSFITITDPDDSSRTLLLAGKNNIGRKAEGLAYRIESAFVGPNNSILTSRIVWDHLPVRITANEALEKEAEKKRGGATRDAEDFIRERLGNGGIATKDFEGEASALGIAKRTLERARKRLNVKAKKDGFQGEWRLFIDKERAGGKDS
jgi:putative DNA primase/helicase